MTRSELIKGINAILEPFKKGISGVNANGDGFTNGLLTKFGLGQFNNVVDVTAIRAFDTVYQNTTNFPIFVTVNINLGVTPTSAAYIDTVNPPTHIISHMDGTIGKNVALTFIVPVNYYYKVTAGAGRALITWWEQ